MTDHAPWRQVELLTYQQALLDGLRPIAARLDFNTVTPESGVSVVRINKAWVVRFIAEPRDSRIDGVNLLASPSQCTLAYAEAEVVECHSEPEAAPDLVHLVIDSIQRYLSGITLIRYEDPKGRVCGAEYFFGADAGDLEKERIGISRCLTLTRKVHQSEVLRVRFLKNEGAA